MKRTLTLISAITALVGCAEADTINCFELDQLPPSIDRGTCEAVGVVTKSFSNHYLERRTAGRREFVILDFFEKPQLVDEITLGEEYEFSGRFLRLEGIIFRVEVDDSAVLRQIQ